MPRLVLHGMQTSQAVQVRDRLFKALDALKLDTETVIEILPSRVIDCNGRESSFLEIISTDLPEAELMADDLGVRTICLMYDLDIEVSNAVCRFIPRESLKPTVADERRGN